MSSILLRYKKGSKAIFDFRLTDGLGNYIYPDFDDPELKVEFYDSGSALRFTATPSTNPPLSKETDAQGPYLLVKDIEISDYSLGVVEARIYCRLDGAEVEPYPTIIEAFEVVAGLGEEPVYTTVSRVVQELPGGLPEELTEDVILQFIYDASRRIDAYLLGYYSVPFPGIEQQPSTPAVIERIARKLAVFDSLVFLNRADRFVGESNLEELSLQELSRLKEGAKGECLPGYFYSLPVYQGLLYQDDKNNKDVID